MRRIHFTVSMCAAALLAGTVTAQDAPRVRAGGPPPGDPAAEREAGFYRASEILGTTVRGADGQELGQIQDLLIEQRTQQIRYFILGQGEAVEAQGSLTVVPWMAARPEFRGDERFVTVRVEQQRLQQAPSFTWQEIQTGPAGWTTEVDRFFGVRGRGVRPGAEIEVEDDGIEIEDRDRPDRPRPRRGEVEIEDEGRDVEVEGRVRPGTRPRADVDVRPNGEVEVRPEASEVEGDIEGDVEPQARPQAEVEIQAEGDE